MTLRIRRLIWDEANVAHIARHHVTPDEVEEICDASHWSKRASGSQKRLLYGQTDAGRYLLVILSERDEPQVYRTVTARDMTDAERRLYRHHGKKG